MDQVYKPGLITDQLDAIRSDFPRFISAVNARAPELAQDGRLKLHVSPPQPVSKLPTFDKSAEISPSAMLRERFEYAGEIQRAGEVWLAPEQMKKQLGTQELRIFHQSLREHWDASAPMQYDDSILGLFAVSLGADMGLTYLVWCNGNYSEPQLWLYTGMEEKRFANLVEFLDWCLSK